MAKLIWDQTGQKTYETGVDLGVLYPIDNSGVYSTGHAWNGLASISENPTGAEATAIYADNIKYLNLISAEEFGYTIEAFTYPDEFAECDGSAEIVTGAIIGQQNRKTFGLCYRTVLGNDVANNDYGYKLHCIYGSVASPSEKGYTTINDSPDAITFSWECKTTPVNVKNHKPTACVTIDSTKVASAKLKNLEDILYGKDHELTTTEPSDWATAYTDYYTKSGNIYTKVTGDNAPTWAENTYYTAEIGSRLPLPDEIATILT